MNRHITIALAASAALLLCDTSQAETHSGLINSSKLEDQKITDPQGNQLGELEGLLLDPMTGTVQYALVETDGVRDESDRSVAIPWSAFKLESDPATGFKLSLDATTEKIANAPRFQEEQANQLFTPEGSDSVRSYWSTPEGGTGTVQNSPPGGTPPGQPQPGSEPTENYYELNRPMLSPSAAAENNSPSGAQQSVTGVPESERVLPPDDSGTGALPDQTNRSLDQAADLDNPPQPPSRETESTPPRGLTIPN